MSMYQVPRRKWTAHDDLLRTIAEANYNGYSAYECYSHIQIDGSAANIVYEYQGLHRIFVAIVIDRGHAGLCEQKKFLCLQECSDTRARMRAFSAPDLPSLARAVVKKVIHEARAVDNMKKHRKSEIGDYTVTFYAASVLTYIPDTTGNIFAQNKFDELEKRFLTTV